MKLFRWLNTAVVQHLRTIEMVGVLMRIFSFSLVSWLGAQESPRNSTIQCLLAGV